MRRRDFLKSSAGFAMGVAMPHYPDKKTAQPLRTKRPLMNAYYFRAHTYTMVPRQVREDMKWMSGLGTDIVSVSLLEQDLYAAVSNIEIIVREAQKEGMTVFAVPARWGGIVAGAPKVPSVFSVQNPQTWVLEEDGTPKWRSVSGVMSSIHYPEVTNFFCETIDTVFRIWDLEGVIWDEPKSFQEDYSPQARKNLGNEPGFEKQVEAVVDFYSRVNRFIKENHSDKTTCLFTYANVSDLIVRMAATIDALDYYGCDGRPWYDADGGKQELQGKVLLGKRSGERFLELARKNGKGTLMLIENHNMRIEDNRLMDKRLPEVLGLDLDHIIYYYYPRNLEDPDANMRILEKHLLRLKR